MESGITKKSRAAFIISMTIIGIAGLLALVISVLAFMPVNVVKANTQPYKVVTPIIKAGDPIIYIADVCKYKEVSSVVSRTFVDEDNVHYPLPDRISVVPAGCTKNKVVVTTFSSFHSGKWYLILDVEYQVNAFRKQTYHFSTNKFTIINKE